MGALGEALTNKSAHMDAGWTRTCQKAPEARDHSPACSVSCPTLSWQQSPQKSLQRTLSDESLCSGRREPSFASPASLEPGLPSDVLFTSTCPFPSSTLPARRQHQHAHPPSGAPSTTPATGNGFPEKKCKPGHLGAVGPPGARKWGTLQVGGTWWSHVARPCEGGKGAQVLQGTSRSEYYWPNAWSPETRHRQPPHTPPRPRTGVDIVSFPATMPYYPPCSQINVSFPEDLLSDLTLPDMPCLVGFLGEIHPHLYFIQQVFIDHAP